MTTKNTTSLRRPRTYRPASLGDARSRRSRLVVDVRVASLNPVAPYLQTFGLATAELPEEALARDASGQVVDVSDSTSPYRVGDAVCFPTRVPAPGERPRVRCWVDERDADLPLDADHLQRAREALGACDSVGHLALSKD